ncbi:MAG TPA: accessory factor UbiK family protein [Gammaproteobacteria bacterium]|nr:accessory factor UbiK family protein [Gammaproteobacteria bacterium]
MSKTDSLKNLVDQLTQALPSHVGALKDDVEKNCRRILTNAFSKLELVTREEFDAQSKVLLRTRKKLEALEKQLKELEHKLTSKHKHE